MNTASDVKVWDPLVRLFHWTLVIAFSVAYLTEGDLQSVHVWAGYTVTGLLAVRLVWGFIGSRYARFSDFVYSPWVTFRYLINVLRGSAQRYLGHNPAGGAMILLMLISLLVTVISGMALYGADQWQGPLAGLLRNVDASWVDALEEIHEVVANLTVALVVFHVLGVLWESLLHKENLVRSMINGRKRA